MENQPFEDVFWCISYLCVKKIKLWIFTSSHVDVFSEENN